MNVARTTVQRIYNDARKSFRNLVQESFWIEGGDYKLCDQDPQLYGCTRCYRHRHGRNYKTYTTKGEKP